MQYKKPTPLLCRSKSPPLCPVCGTPSYSRGGIHPQCAQERADHQRTQRILAKRTNEKPKAAVANPLALNPWHKRCPKCQLQVHVRKASCTCGHQFR